MPTISTFYGIAIRMYYDDHAPAHFHAYYGGQAAQLAIDTLQVIEGGLPRRALAFVLEWAETHRDELRANWQRAEAHEALAAIAPLE